MTWGLRIQDCVLGVPIGESTRDKELVEYRIPKFGLGPVPYLVFANVEREDAIPLL